AQPDEIRRRGRRPRGLRGHRRLPVRLGAADAARRGTGLMLLEQFFDAGLGHASYLVADPDEGVAFLVDPDRHLQPYLDRAAKLGVLITHSFETHVHNDYVAGSPALAQVRPITVVTGADARVGYPHIALADGQTIAVGGLRVRCVATPGHTPEHVAFLLSDLSRADDPQYLFS